MPGHLDYSDKSEQQAGGCGLGEGFGEGPGLRDRPLQMTQEPPGSDGQTEAMPETRRRSQWAILL